MEVNSIGEILALDKKDYLNRRLQTILVKKEVARTAKEAQQLITHRRILVNNKAVDSPSYLVPLALENKISLKQKITKSDRGKNNE